MKSTYSMSQKQFSAIISYIIFQSNTFSFTEIFTRIRFLLDNWIIQSLVEIINGLLLILKSILMIIGILIIDELLIFILSLIILSILMIILCILVLGSDSLLLIKKIRFYVHQILPNVKLVPLIWLWKPVIKTILTSLFNGH